MGIPCSTKHQSSPPLPPMPRRPRRVFGEGAHQSHWHVISAPRWSGWCGKQLGGVCYNIYMFIYIIYSTCIYEIYVTSMYINIVCFFRVKSELRTPSSEVVAPSNSKQILSQIYPKQPMCLKTAQPYMCKMHKIAPSTPFLI